MRCGCTLVDSNSEQEVVVVGGAQEGRSPMLGPALTRFLSVSLVARVCWVAPMHRSVSLVARVCWVARSVSLAEFRTSSAGRAHLSAIS